MNAWEYQIISEDPEATNKSIVALLNEYGKSGWEHYDTREFTDRDQGIRVTRYYFKRPK